MELKMWQVAFADLLILDKVDLVGRRQVQRVPEWLDGRMSNYRLLEAERRDVPFDVLLSAGRVGASPAMEVHDREHRTARTPLAA